MQAETRGANRACWRDDDGAGPAPTVSRSGTLRTALLLSAAAGALLFGYGRSVRAQVVPPAFPCDQISGTTVTCTGDVSAGIATGAPFTTLDVNTLTTDIAPASGVDGINFTSAGAVTITSDTGAFGISTMGDNADGIYALSDAGAVTVTQMGDISTAGIGSEGIVTFSSGNGTVTVTQTGDISIAGTTDSHGIVAASNGGAVTVTQTGDISTAGDFSDGIRAFTLTAC